MPAWATGAWATGAWAIGAWATGSSSTPVSTSSTPQYAAIVHTVNSDLATLTATSEATGYPVENVQSVKRSAVYRSADLAGSPAMRIDGTYDGDSRGASFFGLFQHKLHGATGQLVLYPNDDWTGTPVYNSLAFSIGTLVSLSQTFGLVEGTAEDTDLLYLEQPLGLWFDMTYHKSWSFFMSGTPTGENGTSRTQYEIGRLILGPAYAFSRGVDFLPGLSFPTNTGRGRSGGGSNLRARGSRWKKLECNMKAVTDDDQAALAWMLEYMSDGRDGVLSIYPSDTGWKGRAYLLNGCFSSEDAYTMDVTYSSRKLVFESN